MDFLYQCDNRYAPFTGVSLYSLLENNKSLDRIRLFVIDDMISEENRRRMSDCVESYGREIIFLDGRTLMSDPDTARIQTYKGTRKNTHSFLKMLAIDQLPDDVNRILYLDSDTLVLGDLSSLNTVDLEGNTIAMVLDSLVDKKKALIGFERTDPYYNSGVIYVDVKKWKRENSRKRLIEHSMNHSYGTVDQDILNVVFKGQIYTLAPEYNFQPHHLVYSEKDYFSVYTHKNGLYYTTDEIRDAREHIRIMHFFRYLGEQPWHVGNLHPCTEYFDEYLKQSPWSDYMKEKSGRGLLFEVEKVIYRIVPKRLFLRIFTSFFTLKLKRDLKAGQ